MDTGSIAKETAILAVWYLGSAMHSVVTKSALVGEFSSEKALVNRMTFGAVVASLQLGLAVLVACPFVAYRCFKSAAEYKKTMTAFATNDFILSAALYALANICANTALGGGRVLLVQILKCSELILTTVISWAIAGTAAPTSQIAALGVSSAGIILVVFNTIGNVPAGRLSSSAISSSSYGELIAVIFALLGAVSISVRNVLVSKNNKGEGALLPFVMLSLVATVVSLGVSFLLLVFGGTAQSISMEAAFVSGIFHCSYNFASLGFLAMVGSPLVHAYYNAIKRAVIIITAEVLRCGFPTSIQVLGSSMAIVGLHLSKKSTNSSSNNAATIPTCSNTILPTDSCDCTAVHLTTSSTTACTDNDKKLMTKTDALAGRASSQQPSRYPSSISFAGAICVCLFFWQTNVVTRCGSYPYWQNTFTHSSSITVSSGQLFESSLNNQAISIFVSSFHSNEVTKSDVDENLARAERCLKRDSFASVTVVQQLEMLDFYRNLTRGFTRAAMIGLADHENKGDAAINYGQHRILQELDIPVVYFCAPQNVAECDYIALLSIAESSLEPLLIFATGGGNFGDLWMKYPDDRQRLVDTFRSYPRHPIVAFPQTISFQERTALLAHATAMEHPNITYIARDLNSYRFLLEEPFHYVRVALIPDSAFMIGTQQHAKVPYIDNEFDILWVKRTDKEAKNYEVPVAANSSRSVKVEDWVHNWNTNVNWRHMPRDLKGYSFFQENVTLPRLQKGFNFLRRGKIVVADRLHAHILLTLLKKPHVILDNNYGKIRTYRTTWTNGLVDSNLVEVATGPEDAMKKAENMLYHLELRESSAAKAIRYSSEIASAPRDK
eukprot:TRINITY_DN339_c0_g2_i3.p2 TRINITY_DN339_c0_g2~~TRINITY_DN339_c0_g2_i3.p2  ORF type:complete len:838 (+),score=60.88 TRINITY_DN339_c0_g2_i3:260-2773(+)